MNLVKLWYSFLRNFHEYNFYEKKELIRMQRLLLHHGKQISAEVLNATVDEDKIGSLFPIKLWLKIKLENGTSTIMQTKTLAPLDKFPEKGKIIKIKYLPNDPRSILIA